MKKLVKSSTKNIFSLAIAALFLLCAIYLPGNSTLTKPMISCIFITIMAISLWVFEPVPIGVSSLFVVVLLPLLGLTKTLNDAFAGYANIALFFIITSFSFGLAITKTSFAQKLINFLLRKSGKSYKKIVFAFMLLTYLLSTVMSDFIAVMIGMGLSLEFLTLIDEETEKKRIGKMLLTGITFASILGGFGTPVGSTINVMTLNILKAYNGMDITFMQWMVIAFPISLATLIFSHFVITRLFKADDLKESILVNFANKIKTFKSELKHEKTVLFILAAIIILWIAGSWIPVLNVTMVAIIGLFLLTMPGVEAFTWKEYRDYVPWEIVLMGGAIVALSNITVSTNLIVLIINKISIIASSVSFFSLIIIIGLLVTMLLIVIPTGGAIVAILTIPVYILGVSLGVNSLVMVLVVAMFASNCAILPFNPLVIIPYSKGYFTVGEFAIIGILYSIFWILISALWIPLVSGLVF